MRKLYSWIKFNNGKYFKSHCACWQHFLIRSLHVWFLSFKPPPLWPGRTLEIIRSRRLSFDLPALTLRRKRVPYLWSFLCAVSTSRKLAWGVRLLLLPLPHWDLGQSRESSKAQGIISWCWGRQSERSLDQNIEKNFCSNNGGWIWQWMKRVYKFSLNRGPSQDARMDEKVPWTIAVKINILKVIKKY